MHIAIGHYFIGYRDGVNTVIWRTINELLQIDPSLKITLFGKSSPEIDNFLPWYNQQLKYFNMEEMSPDYRIPGLEGKNVQSQQVHDYIWHGTNIAETLRRELADADVVLIENLSIGVHPAVTYAFYLWSLWEYQAKSNKRFLVRVHDFAQQRPGNFNNIKKFLAYLPSDMPDWHQILYPSTPNIEYIAINTNDYYRLLDHGIEPTRVWYVPNSIDKTLERCDEPCQDLKRILEDKKGIDPETAILFYPVRAIPRKNVEEGMYLTQMLNNLASYPEFREKYLLDPKFHLVVSLSGSSAEEKQYTKRLQDFARENNLPVTIDISDIIGLHREYDPGNPGRIVKYGVADMYSLARMVITTSILEGFGFVFIEPWVMEKCVIGRNIPSVTMDFTKTGLSLDHLYSVLLVNGSDYADLGTDEPDGGLNCRLMEIKKLDDPEYLRMVLQKNNAPLRATLRMFRPERRRSIARSIIRSNCKKVLENYSSPTVVGTLNRILRKEEPTYLVPRHSVQNTSETTIPDNIHVTI
jgi:hypothetical protein